jgi:hypothetical protein
MKLTKESLRQLLLHQKNADMTLLRLCILIAAQMPRERSTTS